MVCARKRRMIVSSPIGRPLLARGVAVEAGHQGLFRGGTIAKYSGRMT